jgi:hypothetical protein
MSYLCNSPYLYKERLRLRPAGRWAMNNRELGCPYFALLGPGGLSSGWFSLLLAKRPLVFKGTGSHNIKFI